MAKRIVETTIMKNGKFKVTFSDNSTQIMTVQEIAAFQQQQGGGQTQKGRVQKSAQDEGTQKKKANPYDQSMDM